MTKANDILGQLESIELLDNNMIEEFESDLMISDVNIREGLTFITFENDKGQSKTMAFGINEEGEFSEDYVGGLSEEVINEITRAEYDNQKGGGKKYGGYGHNVHGEYSSKNYRGGFAGQDKRNLHAARLKDLTDKTDAGKKFGDKSYTRVDDKAVAKAKERHAYKLAGKKNVGTAESPDAYYKRVGRAPAGYHYDEKTKKAVKNVDNMNKGKKK